MKAGAYFQQTADPAIQDHAAFGGLGYSGKNFEEGRFAGPVAADDADYFAGRNLKADVFQSPDFGAALAALPQTTQRRANAGGNCITQTCKP